VTHWKLRATREERESDRSQDPNISVDFSWRNAGAVKRRVRADWESIRKNSKKVAIRVLYRPLL